MSGSAAKLLTLCIMRRIVGQIIRPADPPLSHFQGQNAGSNPAGDAKLSFGLFTGRQVLEKWCGYGGSIESISVERDSFREEQLLQPLLVVERRLHPQV